MSLATLLMAIWFGLYALFTITNVMVENQKFIMGILAALVCILLLVGDRIAWRKSPPPA